MKRLLLVLCLAPLSFGCRAAEAPPEESVKPGINADFLAENLDVERFVQRFEGESREIAVHRDAIVAALDLRPGMAVADVGAGTGLFLEPLAEGVGPGGKVFAVDVAPAFVEHLAERARAGGWEQVEPRLCSERSVELPPASADLAFLCDTYHHFEYPRSTMASLRQALRPGGALVVVDFERIPGHSREWILEHVRAGRDEVVAELASFGFVLVQDLAIEGLEENWAARFARR